MPGRNTRQRGAPGHSFVALLLGLMAIASLQTLAIDGIEITVESVQAPDWLAGKVALQISHPFDQRSMLSLDVTGLKLPGPLANIQALQVACTQFRWSSGQIVCDNGSVLLVTDAGEIKGQGLRFDHDRETGVTTFAVSQIDLADGQLALVGSFDASNWQAELGLTAVALGQLQALLAGHDIKLDALELAGDLTGRVQIAGTDQPGDWDIEIVIDSGLGFFDEAGKLAADSVAGALQVSFDQSESGWQATGSLSLNQGELFIAPVCANPGDKPVTVDFGLSFDPSSGDLSIQHFAVHQVDTLKASGDLQLNSGDQWTLQRARISADVDDLGQLYQSFIQPCVYGTALDSLEMAGSIHVAVDWSPEAVQTVDASFDGIFVDDEMQRFGIDNLSGGGGWHNGGETRELKASWDGGHLYQIDYGASEIHAEVAGLDLHLTESIRLPIFDGFLRVEDFQLHDMGEPELRWAFGGVLEPVSMQAFSQALGWPALGGELSAVVPTVHYQNHRISIDGVVLMNVFDGDVLLKGLSLTDPFSDSPRLQADIDIKPIDLAALTTAFSFGKIEGRLSGHIKGLELNRWQPTRFDAAFATPAKDGSRHRISQRAVDNLSSLGGASITGALSSTYMGFFKEFTYDRLGLSCRLRDSVCLMDGVAPAENGYYIVKGGFIPPVINVLGYTRLVNWQTLMARVRQAVGSGGPILR